MLALPFPSSPSVMLMVPAMLVWCCMESRRLLVLLSSKHNIHEHDDSAVHWPINPDSTLRSKNWEEASAAAANNFSQQTANAGAIRRWEVWCSMKVRLLGGTAAPPDVPHAAVRLLFQSYLVVRGCSRAPRTGSYTTENFSPRITKLSCSVSVRRTLDQVWLYLFVWKNWENKNFTKKSEERRN